MRRFSLAVVVCIFLLPDAQSQTVVNRVRLANHVEASTFISNGPGANTVAFIDAYNVYSLAVAGHTNAAPKQLFSTLGIPDRYMPRGIAYVEKEKRFAFTNNTDPSSIYLTDDKGVLQETIQVTWPANQELPAYIEGIAWAGSKDANFPNHFLVAVNHLDNPTRIATIARTGTVDGLIAPSLDIYYGSGLAYANQNQLMLTDTNSNLILVMDVNGNVQQTVNTGIVDAEGITPLPDGKIALFGVDNGQMIVVDGSFQPIPSLTRNFLVGTGLEFCQGASWNTDAATFLSVCDRYDFAQSGLWNIAPDGSSATKDVDYNAYLPFAPYADPIYLSDKHLIATNFTGTPQGVQLYTPSGQDAGSYAMNYGPEQTYIPATGQIVGKSGPSALVFFDALTGANWQYMDLTSLGVTNINAVAYFESNSTGKLLVFDGPSEIAFILKLDGSLVSSFNYVNTLGVLEPGAAARIDSGPNAGSLMVLEPDPNRITVFQPQLSE